MNNKFDVIVVGSGPGGYVAAIRASQLGLKTAIVEEKHLGGICLNWGCIPTKALLKGAEVAHSLKQLDQFGFSVENIQFDLDKLVKHSRSVSSQLAKGIEHLMHKNAIQVIYGRASMKAKCELNVQHEGKSSTYKAGHIILATGARPRNIPGVEADGHLIWSYFEAMTPKTLPKKLLVIGSGSIGVEFASLYSDLGVDVTLIEVLNQLMPAEDKEISKLAEKSFRKRGINVRTKTRLLSLEKGKNSLTCILEDSKGNQEPIAVDRLILATGIQGNIENLGLEPLRVELNNRFIKTDPWGRTNLVGLYAIGDVAGPPCLAHKASHQGIVCVEKLAGLDNITPIEKDRIPGCTYCRPQIASIGLTEAQARGKGHPLKIGRFNYQANGKALAMADHEGFVKTIFDAKTGELLGAHMIGPEVTEQIQGFGIAQTLEATEEDLMHTVFAHPTLSEAMHESVLAAYSKAIHQ